MPSQHNYDLLVVGGGPAGLAAAMNARYERLDTVLVEENELGGQAGTSSLIENYAGFNRGVTGPDLANEMIKHARKFGAELYAPLRVTGLEVTDEGFEVKDDNYQAFMARSVLIATGVQYVTHTAENLPLFLNRGVTYGSPNLAVSNSNEELVVVGGANSAGQAAVLLSDCDGCNVHMLVRGQSLEDKMSGHLIDKIDDIENIQVHTGTELVRVDGDGHLEEVTVADTDTGVRRKMVAHQLFLLIGARPKTMWLPGDVDRDDHKFVVAGRDLSEEVRDRFEGHCGRQPFEHETSVPGLFVSGDVRSNSVKRVASAVGEGSAVVPEIGQHINYISERT